MNVKYVIR